LDVKVSKDCKVRACSARGDVAGVILHTLSISGRYSLSVWHKAVICFR